MHDPEQHADQNQRERRSRELFEHSADCGGADHGLKGEPIARRDRAQKGGDHLRSTQTVDRAGGDLAGDAVIDPHRRHHHIKERGDDDAGAFGGDRRLERQPGCDAEPAAQDCRRADQKIEYDAEEVVPLDCLERLRDRLDAELLDSLRLVVAVSQLALDRGVESRFGHESLSLNVGEHRSWI